MHESFVEYLERKSTGNSTYKEFAKLAVEDDAFYGPVDLAYLMCAIKMWSVSESEIQQYLTDCARAWVNWTDSERRICEYENYERHQSSSQMSAAC